MTEFAICVLSYWLSILARMHECMLARMCVKETEEHAYADGFPMQTKTSC